MNWRIATDSAEEIIDWFQGRGDALLIAVGTDKVQIELCGMGHQGADLYDAAKEALTWYLDQNPNAVDRAVEDGLAYQFDVVDGREVRDAKATRRILHSYIDEPAEFRYRDVVLNDAIFNPKHWPMFPNVVGMDPDRTREIVRELREIDDKMAANVAAMAVQSIWIKPNSCAHEPVDTGMRRSWCKHCNADFNLVDGKWVAG